MKSNLLFSKKFKARYKKRISKNTQLVRDFLGAVEIFETDRTSPVINDHKLRNKMFQYRAFSINENYRVIFIYSERDDEFIFLDIGTHDQVYKE